MFQVRLQSGATQCDADNTALFVASSPELLKARIGADVWDSGEVRSDVLHLAKSTKVPPYNPTNAIIGKYR